MKKNSKIYSISLFVFILILVLFQNEGMTAYAKDYGITTIQHSPETISTGMNLNVTIDFYDQTEILNIRLLLCQLSPDFVCSAPIEMEKISPNIFSGIFNVTYPEGSVLGYHIMIVYENYSSVIVPDSLDFLSIDNIVEPLPGEYYIQIPIQTATTITETNTETSNNDTELTNGFASTLSFLVLVSFVYLRKRRIK